MGRLWKTWTRWTCALREYDFHFRVLERKRDINLHTAREEKLWMCLLLRSAGTIVSSHVESALCAVAVAVSVIEREMFKKNEVSQLYLRLITMQQQ